MNRKPNPNRRRPPSAPANRRVIASLNVSASVLAVLAAAAGWHLPGAQP